MLSDEIKQLLDGANFAHLATLMPDGSPQSVPVWVGRDADRILICTGENSLKARNTARDPRVALSIVDFRDPYSEVQIRGRVVERRPDPDLKIMDPISLKYTGKPFPFRSPEGRVALVIEVGRPVILSCPLNTHRQPVRRAPATEAFQRSASADRKGRRYHSMHVAAAARATRVDQEMSAHP